MDIRVRRGAALAAITVAGLACGAAPPPEPSADGLPADAAPPPASGAAPATARAPEAAAPAARIPAAAPSPAAPPAVAAGDGAAAAAPSRVAAPPVADPPAAEPALTVPPDTAVLHIGDSFALAGFAQALRPRMEALRVRYAVKAETSSYTTTWAPRMELLVANYQPDLVIISLGANEVEAFNPPAHAGAVRRIVKAIGGRPCVWVSPPLWRKDTGIIDVIRTSSAPCRFFDSDALVPGPIPRKRDKIHPNAEGGARWAEVFWRWLAAEHLPAGEDAGAAAPRRSPWALRPPPPDEHRARPALAGAPAP
ncbi:SGNH/GDSL hydrolase family protein [Sorangium sp. So ce1036]|uniref:SGNH/GDSL hydrolase family protein n=1 Tax=Sorangium sp. So ce1036 TaxID=3133328 RepID=UPI003F0C7E48